MTNNNFDCSVRVFKNCFSLKWTYCCNIKCVPLVYSLLESWFYHLWGTDMQLCCCFSDKHLVSSLASILLVIFTGHHAFLHSPSHDTLGIFHLLGCYQPHAHLDRQCGTGTLLLVLTISRSLLFYHNAAAFEVIYNVIHFTLSFISFPLNRLFTTWFVTNSLMTEVAFLKPQNKTYKTTNTRWAFYWHLLYTCQRSLHKLKVISAPYITG